MKKTSKEEQVNIVEGVGAGLSAFFGSKISKQTTQTAAELLTIAFFSEEKAIHFTVQGDPKARL